MEGECQEVGMIIMPASLAGKECTLQFDLEKVSQLDLGGVIHDVLRKGMRRISRLATRQGTL